MHHPKDESGIALIVTLLTLTVFALMTLGFFYMVIGEQKIAGSERDNTVAFYGAEAALENQSYQIANLFAHTVSPTPAEIDALDSTPPSIPGVTFPAVGATGFTNGGYYIGYQTTSGGALESTAETIGGTGPLAGLQGVVTPLTLTAIAQGPNKTEVKLVREVQEVAVPVFEFGIFSNNDLSFFAGPDFSFGGRVATNGNLYLAEGSGTLTLPEKVTAVGDVIRAQLSNGYSTSSSYASTVKVVTTPGSYRALGLTEGSVAAGPGSAANSGWKTISLTDYNGNILTSATGARPLNMAFAIPGAGNSPIEIIQRAMSTDSSALSDARLENQASVRILLSDSTSDLPDGTAAVPLDGTLNSSNTYGYTVDSCHAPLALSPGPVQPSPNDDVEQDNDFLTPANTPLIGGYIEIDYQTSSGAWQNVTMEILNLGITPTAAGTCTNYHPVLRLEQLNAYTCNPLPGGVSAPCTIRTAGSTNPYDYIPINIYDTREGNARDVNDNTIHLNGVMNIIGLDVHNLQLWFAGQTGTSGALALNNGGYIVYFSDRRGNFDPNLSTPGETGEFGNEDIINPSSSTGTPDGVLDASEDMNGNGILDTYGATPSCASTSSPAYPCKGAAPLNSAATPQATVSAGVAEKNAVIFFRHALRLVDGSLGNLPPQNVANCSVALGANGSGGFTVASENPAYVWKDYNADSGNAFSDAPNACHVPAAVMADAVTLLSNSWQDVNSFNSPTNSGGRDAAVTYYRTAIMGGATIPFQRPTGYVTYQDFGTDGGVHNFLRMLESWSGQTLYYRGSIADFYYSRQATGVYKDGLVNSVYVPPTRAYNFDTDFQSISKLPPGTPRFTDVNALGFQQVLLSSQ